MHTIAVLLAIATVLCSWLLVSLRRHRRKRLQHARVLASKLALAENAGRPSRSTRQASKSSSSLCRTGCCGRRPAGHR